MKVVLFAGGLGSRMREETEFRPKPMTEIGSRPVLWHIMKIFAHYGHNEFVICAGYKAQMIKQFFLDYSAHTSDFTVGLDGSNSPVFHASHGEKDWTVTVVDTGLETQTGGRLAQVRPYLGDAPFLCTYGDGIAPVDLDRLLQHHKRSGKAASMTVTRPSSRFGVVETDADGTVTSFREKPTSDDLVNIGFFVFNDQIFRGLNRDTVLEEDPLKRLAAEGQLSSFEHDGFWKPMDTFREYQELNGLWNNGNAPWKIWAS